MKPRHRRIAFIGIGLLALGLATLLVLNALRSNLVFFFSPSQVAANEAPRNGAFRIGGLVEQGSVSRASDGLTVRFVVTDLAQRVPVSYTGLLPDLFREGKGVVAAGRLRADGSFEATQVLAKHDENYMPPEAAAALDKARQAHASPTLEGPPQ
jgi:cytochrome c-type biogenesis protein CcmE